MDYTSATYYYDFAHPSIQKLIQDLDTDILTPKEKAVKLYLKVRDDWRYNPYEISALKAKHTASFVAQKEEGHCIDKSTLLIAGLRGLGIPARIQLAKVKNHIAVERLTEKFGTNELTPHGMVSILLNDKWVKASPAFNATLCERCKVDPLDFDGENDSIFQEYNRDGNEFMEYLEDYGTFEDHPYEFIIQNMKDHYPELTQRFDLELDIKLD